jgi:peptidase M28-like protein
METQRDDERGGANRWFAVHVAAFLGLLLLALVRYAPPRVKGPDVAGDVFSAGRVRELLERTIRPGVPHPTGSADHARMRDAVIAEFRALGLEPEIQETFASFGNGDAEQVQNIVVHLRGTEGDDAIALVAHYDSVPAGPGVADDASGVCSILEIARMFAEGPAPRNDVIFLITDAEELGLHGARAFDAEHPLAKKIRVVLNWEARGTRGPSFMFQTGPNNLGLIRLMSRHCRRSISTSLFPAVYRLLPNDTDLTVFIERGVAGMNFAFIGGVPHYHRPCDNLENLDLGSVQHQGEHFLAMARALTEVRLDELPEGDAVFFDVLGWFTIRWPERWNLTFAIGVAVLALTVLVVSLRDSKRPVLSLVLSLLVWPVALVVAALLGAGACQLVITCTGAPVPWWSWAQPMTVALWCVGIGVPVAVWSLVRRRVSGDVTSVVMMVYWSVLGILLAWYLPGASYLFTVPAVIACLSRLFAAWRGFRWEVANLAFLMSVCVLWLPLVRGLLDAFGVTPSFAQTVPMALVGLLIAVTVTTDTRILRFLLLVAGVGLVGLGAAMVVPTYTERWPQPVSIQYRQDDKEAQVSARANLGQLPGQMCRAVSRQPDRDAPHYLAFKVESELAPPTVEILEEEAVDDGRRLRLLLKPGIGEHRVIIGAESGMGSDVVVNGRPIASPVTSLAFNFSEMAEAEIELTTTGKITLGVWGIRYDLPASAESLRKGRPVWAAPVGRGDHMTVTTQVEL